ncbi:MAG: hypothetical protein LBL32_01000 [Holosporales bacterium]|jgi:predicted component of type VI protein secretion system|nr:hypothetical protein [Holosporales bacterium]
MRIDRPLLEKFTERSVYFNSKSDFIRSVVSEIGNILSSRLGFTSLIKDSPFSYGTKDLPSVNISSEDLETFGATCREAILYYESRLKAVEINDIRVDRDAQIIFLDIVCYPKLKDFSTFPIQVKRQVF